MKILRKRKDTFEILMEGNYGSSKFRKAVQKAYMDISFTKYKVRDMVVFNQGAYRGVAIPLDIVEDIIGVKLEISERAA